MITEIKKLVVTKRRQKPYMNFKEYFKNFIWISLCNCVFTLPYTTSGKGRNRLQLLLRVRRPVSYTHLLWWYIHKHQMEKWFVHNIEVVIQGPLMWLVHSSLQWAPLHTFIWIFRWWDNRLSVILWGNCRQLPSCEKFPVINFEIIESEEINVTKLI